MVNVLRHQIFSLLFGLSCCYLQTTTAQNSLNTDEEKSKEQFQEAFFSALTQKSIQNYQKAIENLDECNEITPNNVGVLFELSKNYLFLNKTEEASEYAKQALQVDPANLWVLEHLVAIYKKQRNFNDAINIQEKIAVAYPNKKQRLVYLHLQNKNKKGAKKVLNELAKAKMLNPRLRKLQKNLFGKKKIYTATHKTTFIGKNHEKKEFEKKQSFSNLKALLKKLEIENSAELLTYSEKGLSLFPAQPFVYLMNGKAYNQKKSFKKALEALENGIDFVIDDLKMENAFYKEFIKSYEGLGARDKAKKYQSKIK